VAGAESSVPVEVLPEAEPTAVRLPLVTSLVGASGSDVRRAGVPREVGLVPREARHLDGEDELAVLLGQFVVGAPDPVLDEPGREIEARCPVSRLRAADSGRRAACVTYYH
jgi:hypothetical protein